MSTLARRRELVVRATLRARRRVSQNHNANSTAGAAALSSASNTVTQTVSRTWGGTYVLVPSTWAVNGVEAEFSVTVFCSCHGAKLEVLKEAKQMVRGR